MTNSPTKKIYAELQHAFDVFNYRLFNNELPKCLITLQRKANTTGYFSKARFIATKNKHEFTHELALNPEYFGVNTIIETMQTIAHEMCHLWQDEYGTPSRKTYHNSEWANKMQSIGLMPSDTGRPGGKRTGQYMADYPMEDGLFLQVCRELFATDYNLSWYDRYLPPETTQALMENKLSFAHGLDLPQSSLTIPSLELAKANEIVGLKNENLSFQNSVSNTTNLPKATLQVRMANKIKYQCPDCKNNVWGKPNLNVICGDCQKQFLQLNT